MKKMKINPNKLIIALFFLSLAFVFTNTVKASTVNLSNSTIGANIGTANVSINKTSFNTGDSLQLSLTFPKTYGSRTILAGYRVTNNSSFNYNPQLPAKADFWTDDPIPNGMIINSNVIKTDLNNSTLLSNLQPGNYTLFVFFNAASDITPGYIDGTTIPKLKQIAEQPVLYDGLGNRYPWTNYNLFFPNNTGDNYIGVDSINFTVSNTASTPSFDFGISNDGNKTITIGDTADSLINLTNLNAGATGDVTLNVDSIKDSTGAEVKDLSTGLIVGSTAFGQRILTPTANTTLRVQSLGSTIPGTYTVKVTGTYTKQATTVVTTTNTTPYVYYCKVDWTHDNSPTMYNGFYFGCSRDSGFSPSSDYNNGGQFSVKCIQYDDGNCLTSTGTKILGDQGKDMIVNQRIAVATGIYGCGAGGYTITGDPYNVGTGFTCNSVPVNTSVTTGGQTISHSTTYNISVQSAPLPYNLTAIRSANSCNLSDLKITASWDPIPGASSYRLYRNHTDEGQKVYSTTTPYYIVSGKITFEDKVLSFSELYEYSVSAIIAGAEQAQSPSVYAYSPTFLTGASCPQSVASPSIKLFAKESTDTTKDLSIYSLTTTTSASNTDVSLFAGKTFDIRWVSNLTPDYTCRQATLDINDNTNNSLWVYGTGLNSTITGLSTQNKPYGTYKLMLSCTNTAGNTVTSNISRITIKEVPPVYNFTVTTSANQCSASDIWIKQKWSPVPGASSYNLYRIKDGTPEIIVFNVTGTENSEVYPTFTFETGKKYYYKVAAIVGGIEKPASPQISVIAPLEGCPVGVAKSIKLFIKKSSDSNINFSNYTYQTSVSSINNSATVISGDKFDLLWASNLTPDYTVCNQKTIMPTGNTNNSIWSYGTEINGQANSLETAGLEIGTYTLNISCSNGNIVSSNTVKIIIQPAPVIPPNYQFTVTPSSDRCVPMDLWISQTWSPIPNATSYTIKRLNTVINKIDATYILSGSATMNTEKYPVFNAGTKYDYIISAVVSGKTLASSPVASVIAPRVTTVGCPFSSLNLGIKKSVDVSYGPSTSVVRGDTFGLQWTMASPPAGYSCSFNAVKPNGSSGNSIWAWGGSITGTNTSLPTNLSSIVDGSYIFSITCTKTGSATINSNSVTLTVTSPVAPPPPPPPPDPINGGGGGNNGQNPPPPAPPIVTNNPLIKLFIGGSAVVDKPFETPVVGDPKAVVPYKVGPTGTFNLAWKSNSLNGYSCTSVTIKPDGSDGSAVWNWFNNSKNGSALGLEAKIAETGTYSFYAQCIKDDDQDIREYSNTVLLRISNAGEI